MTASNTGPNSEHPFELFLGCLGNGTTVCNKAIMEYGDFKKIAHISNDGYITWYVEPTSIPGDALLHIEHCANVDREKFEKWFSELPIVSQYQYLLDRVPHHVFMTVTQMSCDIKDKVKFILDFMSGTSIG